MTGGHPASVKKGRDGDREETVELRRIWNAVSSATLACACAGGCGGPSQPFEVATTLSSPIQGGTSDATHLFAVGVVLRAGRGAALCSGALLAPNLVATARHCVAQISSANIDCATSTFGSVAAPSSVSVTTDASIRASGTAYGVSKIIVPSASNQTRVCGNDLALLILSQTIALPQYVTPVINPPMTDHRTYTTTVTAIGYGISTPTDTTGTTSGVRRIKENVDLVCIPNDTGFVDCFPSAAQYMSANEFQSGNAVCEGDSGSSAFEQRDFNGGNWVSFGVLSRGGVDLDAGTCVGGIYTRFDAWGPLIIDAANQAASLGGYSPPGWAVSPSKGVDAGDAAPSSAAEGGASSALEGGSCSKNGALCNGNGECCTTNCLSHNQGSTFACTACDGSNPCDTNYTCQQGACVPTATVDGGGGDRATSTAKGCSCGLVGGPFTRVPRHAKWAGLGVAALTLARRRRSRPVLRS
jgi:trypsin